MGREIRGRFGLIEGAYKTEASPPIISKPCEHVTLVSERSLRDDILVIIHGKEDGAASVMEHVIGGGNSGGC